MSGIEHLSASALHQQRRLHLGRQVATAGGWRTVLDITAQKRDGGAVIVRLVGTSDVLFLWPRTLVSVRNHHELERGNCFGIYHRGVIIETHRERPAAVYAAHDPADACSMSAQVVLVCPVHPQYLSGEWCGECTDFDLSAVLAAEDVAEDHGLHPDDRRTCHLCRTWATPEHIASPFHRSTRFRAAARIAELLLSA